MSIPSIKAPNKKSNSILMALIGPTGAGKTTFLNRLCGTNLGVSDRLESCTNQVQTGQCSIDGHTIILIDTPGLDDTLRSQAEVLYDIAEFLKKTYQRKLTGFIYMYRISDVRAGGISRQNFRLFTKICGDHAMKRAIIATTMWEDVAEEVGVKREDELASKEIFFKTAISNGARMLRHHNNRESAERIIRQLLGMDAEVLQMQRELVDERKSVLQTMAGQELQGGLGEELQKQKKIIVDVSSRMQHEVQIVHERETVVQLQESLEKAMQMIKRVEAELDQLVARNKPRTQMSIGRRVWHSLRGGKSEESSTGWKCIGADLVLD